MLQAVLSEISAGLPDDQPSAATSLNGSLGDLASLTAGETGGLGGLDFEDEAPPTRRQPDIVQTADHAYQVCDYSYHRLNMEDRSPKFIWDPCHVMCTAVLIVRDPATPPHPPHSDSYTSELLVSKERRHLFVTS